MTKRGRLNTLLKKIIVGILLVLVILGTTFTASAESETYIKVDVPGNLQEQRLSKDMYYPVAEINAAKAEPLKKINPSAAALCWKNSLKPEPRKLFCKTPNPTWAPTGCTPW